MAAYAQERGIPRATTASATDMVSRGAVVGARTLYGTGSAHPAKPRGCRRITRGVATYVNKRVALGLSGARPDKHLRVMSRSHPVRQGISGPSPPGGAGTGGAGGAVGPSREHVFWTVDNGSSHRG